MTKVKRVELESTLEEINAAVDEYSAIIVGLTDKPHAAALLLDALNMETMQAGIIRHKLKQAEKENDE